MSHEEVEALRAMLKEMKAKVERYEAALVEIAKGPMDVDDDLEPDFSLRAQNLAKVVLAP